MGKVVVIGAGLMGAGVAQNFAQKGYSVTLIDIAEEVLGKAKESIFENIRYQALFNKEERQDPDDVVGRIHFTTDYQVLKDVDFVVENVPEIWEVKKEVYLKIDSICPKHCIFLVNTSCISITKIASLTKRPAKVIGVHFMNPVPLKTTVETIKGYHTSEETIKAVQELLKAVGKECIIVNDFPGFVSNRLSHLLMNEAAFVVQDRALGNRRSYRNRYGCQFA